jgi:hypothetical protein
MVTFPNTAPSVVMGAPFIEGIKSTLYIMRQKYVTLTNANYYKEFKVRFNWRRGFRWSQKETNIAQVLIQTTLLSDGIC